MLGRYGQRRVRLFLKKKFLTNGRILLGTTELNIVASCVYLLIRVLQRGGGRAKYVRYGPRRMLVIIITRNIDRRGREIIKVLNSNIIID